MKLIVPPVHVERPLQRIEAELSAFGGGLFIYDARGTLNRCRTTGCVTKSRAAYATGGAIRFYSGQASLSECVISDCAAITLANSVVETVAPLQHC
eukprot:5263107-Prymnesium_polylepis.1